MTKEEFKEMFEECFSIVVEIEDENYLHVKIVDRDKYWKLDRKTAIILEDFAWIGK